MSSSEKLSQGLSPLAVMVLMTSMENQCNELKTNN